jgi:hypothetical protein
MLGSELEIAYLTIAVALAATAPGQACAPTSAYKQTF